jgi:DNA-binding PadR family transcriptional regulator
MNSKLFRGSLDTIVLKLLRDKGKMYGYQIAKEVKLISEGRFSITEGSLYPALHKLERKGYLDTEYERVDNRQRKYYRLSPKGKKAVKEEIKEMKSFLTGLSLIVNPEN